MCLDVFLFLLIVFSLSLSVQRSYSPGWASASFRIFLHPSWFRATIFQFLLPYLATSSSTIFPTQPAGAIPTTLSCYEKFFRTSEQFATTHPDECLNKPTRTPQPIFTIHDHFLISFSAVL